MQLLIDNRDLAYTIDTYGMFNGESTDEYESEYYREEYNLTDDEWRELSFDYDHAEIVKALANSSIQLLDQSLIQHGSGIVTAIDLRSTTSPQFYNYTTDGYKADWTIDESKLNAWIDAHFQEYREWLRESGWDIEDVDANIDDKGTVAKLDFWTRSEYDPESYDSEMFEHESEAYSENMTLDADSQKIVDAAQARIDAEKLESERLKNQTNLDLEV